MTKSQQHIIANLVLRKLYQATGNMQWSIGILRTKRLCFRGAALSSANGDYWTCSEKLLQWSSNKKLIWVNTWILTLSQLCRKKRRSTSLKPNNWDPFVKVKRFIDEKRIWNICSAKGTTELPNYLAKEFNHFFHRHNKQPQSNWQEC